MSSSPEASWLVRAAAVAALLACVAAGPAAAQPPAPLFDAAGADSPLARPAGVSNPPQVRRSRTVRLNLPILNRVLVSPASPGFVLNLFDDTTLPVVFERVEDVGLGHRSWVGRIAGRPLSTVTLTVKGDVMSGLITVDEAVYEITAVGDGLYHIDEVDMAAVPPERDIVRTAPGAGPLAAPAGMASPAGTPIVDIFVYYTSALRARMGASQVQARIAQSVTDANSAYLRSGINGQLHLAGYAEIDFPDPIDSELGLDNFSARPDVQAQRNAAGADLVALMASSFGGAGGGGICGIGYVGPSSASAFAIVANQRGCVYTFAHEVGHNFGAQHAPDDGGLVQLQGYPAYARGYKAPNHAFRTVMAYDCSSMPSCPRILNFSNPSVTQGGQATGTPTQNNAYRIDETFAQVASYRSPPGASVPPSAPQNVQAVPNELSVTLQWEPPVSGVPTNYRVVAGTAPGGSDRGQLSVGVSTAINATLPAGLYYVRVFAENEFGSSPASNEVSFRLAPLTPPGPPRALGYAVTGTTVMLAWQPPASGGAPDGYFVEAGTAPGATNVLSGTPAYSNSARFDGVPLGRYYVRVRARNRVGVSAPSNEASFMVIGCVAPPPAPQSLQSWKTGTTVALAWSAVSDPGATYRLEAGSAPGAANLLNLSVGAATAVSTPVPPGTYYVRVRAVTACGVGAASPEVLVSVP